MKKLIMYLMIITLGVNVTSAQCEEKDRAVWGINANYIPKHGIGIGIDMGMLAQSSKMSLIISTGLHKATKPELVLEEGKWIEEEYSYLLASLGANISYKIVYKEYAYAIHIVSGATFSDDGLLFQSGMRLVLPLITKALYIEPLYQFKNGIAIKAGVYMRI
jgi:hypothetical protein